MDLLAIYFSVHPQLRRITAFKVTALIILAILVFWEITRHKQPENRLKKKIAELTAANEKLRQEVGELNQEQVDILEDIIDVEPPIKELTGFNPQEMKALSELVKRLCQDEF